MPKISVIIPAYNAENYIEKCLLSLKEQTFKDFEVVVVDDGSVDKTYEIASKYAKVIRSNGNPSEGAARNLGAHKATGEILAFTDSDVVLPRDWLEKIIKNMESHNVKCVGGGYAGSVGNSFMERFAYLELVYRRRGMPEFVNTLVSNNFACHRDAFFEFGGFPDKFKCEDLRLSFKISKKYPIYWDKTNGVYHHFRPSLVAYLKQQYYFGRDTVWAYYCYPQLLFKKTHQGSNIYIETIFMFLAIVGFALSPLIPAVFLLLILALNTGFLLSLKKEGLSIIYSFLLILTRDVVCVISIFSGMVLCLKDILGRLFLAPLKLIGK